ncbi:MAG TPA: tetratricopeptide repeat protein, partial [Streptosporangiaceae bacterium]|nr:tetratricopeptide repeat protein [Streptosporangiaceae bacterium]
MTSPSTTDDRPGEDPNPLFDLFRQCVVRIDDEAGTFRGTGFFASAGRVLTCADVIHGAQGLQVRWHGHAAPATVAATVPSPDAVAHPTGHLLPDLAVLQMDSGCAWDYPCAQLEDELPSQGAHPDVLYLAGYMIEPDCAPALTGMTTEFESPVREDGREFYKLKRGRLLSGFSGSPLLNTRTGLVSGIVGSTRSRNTDLGGFAVPVTQLAAILPDTTQPNQRWHAAWVRAMETEREQAAKREGSRGRLPLRRPVARLKPNQEVSPATLLRPRHTVVGYVGRDRLLCDIAAWCETERGDPEPELWLVTGPGGSGKTRLAVQACVEAEARGWTTGFLRAEVSQAGLQNLADWPGRLLIVIDYADTRAAILGRLIEELRARGPRPPARIILLVHRSSSGDELLETFNDQQDEDLAGVLRRATVTPLDDAASEVGRLELFDRAVTDLGMRAGSAPARPPRPRLGAAHFARPLSVLVAAVLAGARRDADVDALSEQDLLRELLAGPEASYWDRWNARLQLRLDPQDQRAAVALATLLGADRESEALAIARLIPHLGAEPERRLMAIARWLAKLYPGPAADGRIGIGALEPDRLAEVLAADVLKQHPDLLAAVIASASDRQLARALTVVTRVAAADEVICSQLRACLDARLGDLLERAFGGADDELIAAVIGAMTIARPVNGAAEAGDRFPDVTAVWMRPIAVAVTGLAVDGMRQRAAADPAAKAGLARQLSNHAARLAGAGRRDEALAVSEEAVTRYRELAAAAQATHLPDLAASLSNHAASLVGAGRRDEALAVSEEAVTLRRQLAAASAAYVPDLAMSLSNHAASLAGAGRRDEALALSEEAVTLRRQLAAASPAAYLPDLAMSLSNHAASLAGAGRRDEALAVSEEAVTLRRQLAAANRAGYLPGLASSLSNHANRLAEAGRRDEALAVSEEAVTLRRELAAASRAFYLPDLAASLSNHANRLAGAGRRDEALAVSDEAVTLRRQLAGANRAAYLPDLAKSLSNHANRLAGAGRRDEALAVSDEAVAGYRELATASTAAYLPGLAAALSNHADRLAGAGRRDEALAVSDEAVTLRRQLAGASPAAYLPGLAASLSNHANWLAEAGRAADAEQLIDQLVGHFAHLQGGLGRLLLVRGRWWLTQNRLSDAVPDLASATHALAEAHDLSSRGQARVLLRRLRQEHQSDFDQAWRQTGRALPVWLQHP